MILTALIMMKPWWVQGSPTKIYRSSRYWLSMTARAVQKRTEIKGEKVIRAK